MSFSSTITIDSQICPDVKFTVRRMGLARRTELDLKTLGLRQRLRELEALYPPHTSEEKRISAALEAARKKAASLPREQAVAVLEDEVKSIDEQLAAAAAPEMRAARSRINEEYQSIDAQIRLEWVRDGLISLAGGDVDGWSAEQLLDAGAPELALEIYMALQNSARLGTAAAKNLSSPGTSSGPVDGATNGSIAPAASAPETSATGTVSAAIQNP